MPKIFLQIMPKARGKKDLKIFLSQKQAKNFKVGPILNRLDKTNLNNFLLGGGGGGGVVYFDLLVKMDFYNYIAFFHQM